MKSVIPQNPCDSCTVDRQVGNPYRWQCECDRCAKPGQWRNEAVKRLSEIENVLGDEYDLDELTQLVNAKHEGRCVVLPCKPGDDLYWYNKHENAVKCDKSRIKGVIVLKDGFAVFDTDGNIDPIGTQYACLTAEECQAKFGLKPQNEHFMNRFMEVK